MKRRRISFSALLLTFIIICFAITQLQEPLVVGLGGVGGTFGVGPMTSDCAGLRLDGSKLGWLPRGDSAGRLWLFNYRYQLPADASGTTFCLGQDLWHGE